MKDLEKAHQILELRQGATFKQIAEARDDLLDLWNPDRLSKYPRLRSKSASKIREIHEAYELLMEDPSRIGRGAQRTRQPASSSPAGLESKSGAPSASLFDEVFKPGESKAGVGRRIPTWPFVLLTVIAAFVLGYFISSGGDSEPLINLETQTSSEEVPTGEDPSGVPAPVTEPATADPQTSLEPAPEQVEPVIETQKAAAKPPVQSKSNSAEDTKPPVKPPTRRPSETVRAKPRPPAGTPETTPKPAPPTRVESGGNRPVLLREETSPAAQQETGSTPESTETTLTRAEQAEQAYLSLLGNSEAARKLVNGQFPGLRFLEWQVIDIRDKEIWLDLVTRHAQAGGATAHFVWSVQSETGAAKPVSAAAQNLEKGAI